MSDETVTGHVIGGPADPDYDGAVLTADLALGDLVLHVDDVADFDEESAEHDGGLIVGLEFDASGDLDSATGVSIAYTECDDAAGTVTLAAASTVEASTGDRVYLEDPVSGYPVGTLEILVSIDGGDSTGDALPAFLDVTLLESAGDVDLTGLAVEMREDEDGQLIVLGFPGLIQHSGAVRGFQDFATATGSGDIEIPLTYRAIPGSTIHVYWHGLVMLDDEWSLSDDGGTVTVHDIGFKAGDRFMAKYLHTDPPAGHWVEESYLFRPTTGTPLFGATVVGAASVEDALGDTDAASYVNMPAGSSCNLTTIPRDLTAESWDKMRLELDMTVAGGVTGQLDWDLYVHGAGEFDGSSEFWNAPAIFEDGTLRQKIPVGPEYPEPHMGDNGNVDGVFSIANSVAQAAIDDPDGNHVYLSLDVAAHLVPDFVDVCPTIRVTGARLVVSRWVAG